MKLECSILLVPFFLPQNYRSGFCSAMPPQTCSSTCQPSRWAAPPPGAACAPRKAPDQRPWNTRAGKPVRSSPPGRAATATRTGRLKTCSASSTRPRRCAPPPVSTMPAGICDCNAAAAQFVANQHQQFLGARLDDFKQHARKDRCAAGGRPRSRFRWRNPRASVRGRRRRIRA